MTAERIGWIGGNHRRHLYYINEIAKRMNVVGGIMQVREETIPKPPEGLEKEDELNWIRHFMDRELAEQKYFGDQSEPSFEVLRVDSETLNSPASAEFMRDLAPDVVLVFGSGMIRPPLMESIPTDTVNLHLGLSPRYRGAATLFWPFYMLEPNWAGTTFHHIVHTPDGGEIVHQVVPKLVHDDGIHDVAAKAVLQSTTEALALLKMYPRWKKFGQKPEAGKNFLASDFKPQHLRMIYTEFHNEIVDLYLDGKILAKEPSLKRQFP